MTTQPTAALTPGAHTIEVDGTVQAYHVHGTGPVCVAHPGGPGIPWEYLRVPAAERHLTMVYVEPVGTGASGRLPRHPDGYVRARYSRFLEALIDHLGVGPVHLLGHSHGGFVVQYHALHHPAQVAGVILYDSAPVTGREHGAEAMRQVQAFAARHADRPELPSVLAALQAVPAARDDAGITAALRGLLPAYFADYWNREAEFDAFRRSTGGVYISGVDDNGEPDVIDDREALPRLTAPALVLVGRHDVICSVRWAEELHKLIPGSRLVVFEHSGHFAHLEEPRRFAEAVTRFVTG
ncbi:alpha/beta hydrolase [Streptomyces sp. NPDC001792]|uniref:alpha/beta fold hydrolase n=1 Tax=Streptomyces sp. NPDC001792 TaxID=3154524 RepID=UPI00332CF275